MVGRLGRGVLAGRGGTRGGRLVGGQQIVVLMRLGVLDRGAVRRGLGGLVGLHGLYAGEHLGLFLRRAVVERDDHEHRDEERDGDGDAVDPHLVEHRNREQRCERERGRRHTVHDLAVVQRGREEPAEHGDGDAAGGAAHKHAAVHLLETQMDAVERRLGDAAEQTSGERADRGLAHFGVMVTQRQDQHAGGGTEAGEVPRAHRTLDEVVAHRVDVDEHEGVERPVQAERHEERINHRNQQREDEWRMRVEPCEAHAEPVADPHAERANEERGERADDDHAQERHEHELHRIRDDLLEPVVDEREHGGHEQRYEHVAAVIAELHRHAEDGRGALLGAHDALRAVGLGPVGAHEAHERRRHERGHDRAAKPRVDVELLGRVVGDHDRQEVEHALVQRLHEDPCRRLRLALDPAACDAHVDDRDDERRAEQHAQDRAERIGQVFEERVEPRHLAAGLGAGGRLDVGVRHALRGTAGGLGRGAGCHTLHLGQVHDLVVDIGDTAADDHLIAVAALRDRAQHTFHVLELVLVDLSCINQFETKASGAVRQAFDVIWATNRRDDLRR